MSVKIIATDQAPAAIGPYSQAHWAGDLLFISGQLGMDLASGDLVSGVEAQARRALANLGAILTAAGLGPANIVKSTIFLTDMGDFGAVNQIYADFFPAGTQLPARACVQVAALPKGGLVEVEAVACR